jgi:formylglycine-generating enzyme required for sulfatase activity
MRTWGAVLVALGLLGSLQTAVSADVLNMGGMRDPVTGRWTGLASLETVPVGNPGNMGNPSGVGAGGWGPDRICGSVGHDYRIGTYEVTAGQYVEFLNKVAGVDTYGLYNPKMWTDEYGCKIERFAGNGTTGSPYQYRVLENWANRPVNFVSFWNSCRFTNWLHNGQPNGVQGNSTTEDGAYTLTPQGMASNSINRNANWKWAVTSEDEWYKAAYYDPHKPDGPGYWSYPMGSDGIPSNDLLTPDGGNNANFWQDYECTIGGSYYRTPVGEFELSDSPYGTFDQGGNVWEWNETSVSGSHRVVRGGFFNGDGGNLNALYRYDGSSPANGSGGLGFRVVQVPEPATLSLLALGGLLLVRRRRAMRPLVAVLMVVGLLAGVSRPARADVLNMGGTRNADGSWTGLASLETVPVGNVGNLGQLSGAGAGGYGPDRICGGVSYDYRVGRYEVTAGQYTEFLNKVAATDPRGLYNTHMDYDADPGYWGCNIKRTGVSGSYSYSVAPGWANRPVNYVSFWDACRFANWLHNGQPGGTQDESTTEDGAYTLTAQGVSNNTLTRNSSWRWAVTSEDEWYKAAYYDAAKPGGPGYWLYPTSSNSVPSNDLLTPDGGNNASFNQNGFTIDRPYYRTTVGEFESSESPYGTFDQGGNVWEWNEAVIGVSSRGLRGGAFYSDTSSSGHDLLASLRFSYSATYEDCGFGLRVVQVPEPATLSLLALGGLLLARRRRA